MSGRGKCSFKTMGSFDGSTKEVEKNDIVKKEYDDLSVDMQMEHIPRQDMSDYAEALLEDPVIENKGYTEDLDDMMVFKGKSFLDQVEEKNWKERVANEAGELLFSGTMGGGLGAATGAIGGAAAGAARAKKGERWQGAKRGAKYGAVGGAVAGTAGVRGALGAAKREGRLGQRLNSLSSREADVVLVAPGAIGGTVTGGIMANRKKKSPEEGSIQVKELDDSMVVKKGAAGVAAHALGGAAIGATPGVALAYSMPGSKEQKRKRALILGGMGALTGAGITGASKFADDSAKYFQKLDRDRVESFKKVREDVIDTLQNADEGLRAAARGDEKAMNRAFNRRIQHNPDTDIDIDPADVRSFGKPKGPKKPKSGGDDNLPATKKSAPYEAFVGKGLFKIEEKSWKDKRNYDEDRRMLREVHQGMQFKKKELDDDMLIFKGESFLGQVEEKSIPTGRGSKFLFGFDSGKSKLVKDAWRSSGKRAGKKEIEKEAAKRTAGLGGGYYGAYPKKKKSPDDDMIVAKGPSYFDFEEKGPGAVLLSKVVGDVQGADDAAGMSTEEKLAFIDQLVAEGKFDEAQALLETKGFDDMLIFKGHSFLDQVEKKERARSFYNRRFDPDNPAHGGDIKNPGLSSQEGTGRGNKDLARGGGRGEVPAKWKNSERQLVETLDDETHKRGKDIKRDKLDKVFRERHDLGLQSNYKDPDPSDVDGIKKRKEILSRKFNKPSQEAGKLTRAANYIRARPIKSAAVAAAVPTAGYLAHKYRNKKNG